MACPECGEPVWDRETPFGHALGHKLAKCWGCGIAFQPGDNEEDEEE